MSHEKNLCSIALDLIGIVLLSIFISSMASATTVEYASSSEPYAYVTNYGSNTVSVIDTAINNVTATVKVNSGPVGVAVSPDGSKVYVTNEGYEYAPGNTVSVINVTSNTFETNVTVGSNPFGIAVTPDGTKVYVANAGSNDVSVIDTITNNVITTVPVGGSPNEVAVSPDGKKVYVMNSDSDYFYYISVIDTATNKVTVNIPVESYLTGIAVSSDGTKVYVTSEWGTFSVIDTTTNTVEAKVSLDFPVGVAVSPDGKKVYVTSNYDSVYVIDTATNKVTATVPVGSYLGKVAVNPAGTKVYVTNSNDTVSVIDTATNKVTATVKVGTRPVAIAVGPALGHVTDKYLVQAEGSSDVYLIENGEKHRFTSPEALEWNGYSFDNVTTITNETLQSYSDGENISISQPIIDKYHELGGKPIFGASAGEGEKDGDKDSAGTYCSYVNFENGSIEYFKNGDLSGKAYAVFNPFFNKWASMGYAKSVLGYPIDNMSNEQTSKFGTKFRYQNFANGTEKGALEYNLSSDKVFEIHGAIFAKWGALGYANSELGLVTSDERDAVPSFKGTTGRVSDFENGHLHWHSNGDHYMITYMTYGDLDKFYIKMGGTASDLGFPIKDQETKENGHGYCEFEGGNIFWDDSTGAYKVKLDSEDSTITVGQGASTQEIKQKFIEACDRNGGLDVLGNPTTEVHSAFGFEVQDFPEMPATAGGVITYNPNKNTAYFIHGAIWDKYYAYADKAKLGAVASDEGVAAIKPGKTTGNYTKFETGTIHWISDKTGQNEGNAYRGQSFATYGALDKVYTDLGGTYSDLGFPIMDQETKEDGQGYCKFEGGRIEWDNASRVYKAYYNSISSISCEIVAPVEQGSFKKGEDIVFKGKAEGGSAPYAYVWMIDGKGFSTMYSEYTPPTLSPGEHTVQLQVSDSLGNNAESAVIHFAVYTKKVAVVPIKFSDSGSITSPDRELIKARCELVQGYYRDQSYGTEYIIFDYYKNSAEPDGWFKLGNSSSEFYKAYKNAVSKNAQEADYIRWRSFWQESRTAAGVNGNYDTVMALFAPGFSFRSFGEDKDSLNGAKVMCDAAAGYGTYAHELGHSLYAFRDKYKDAINGEGYIGDWGLMGSGDDINPPAPIIGFEKQKPQVRWIPSSRIIDESDLSGTIEYSISYLDDSALKDEGVLSLRMAYEDLLLPKYYIFEGRRAQDGIVAVSSAEKSLKDSESSLFYNADKGIVIYEVDKMGSIWREPQNAESDGDENKIMEYGVTIYPGKSKLLAYGLLNATCSLEGDKVKLKLEKGEMAYPFVFRLDTRLSSNLETSFEADDSNLDVDLHVVSDDGKHVGMNYGDGSYDNEIEGALTSGNLYGGGPEWITVPEGTNVTAYVTISPDLKAMLETDSAASVEVNSTLMIFNQNGELKKIEPFSLNISAENLQDQYQVPLQAEEQETEPIFPTADFTTNITEGTAPLAVQFNGSSSNATEYLWNFGDGSSSTEANPVHTYSAAGNYTVNLTVSNENGIDSKLATINVSEKTVLPVANFSSNVTSGSAPLSVQFTDRSENATGWSWDFGDGATSTEQNPVHTYKKLGKYTVKLTVKNAQGSNTISKSKYINVVIIVNPPRSAFSASPTFGKAPLTVSFTDKSTRNPTSWKWTFGDGTSSTEQNPVHTYSKVGQYMVKLTVKNVAGSNTALKSNYIIVTNTLIPPTAAFSASPTSGNAPLTVTFTDKSKNSPDSWKWNFGDGSSSTEQNSVHTYSKVGQYIVTLTVKNAAGSNTKALSKYIVVSKK